MPPAPSPRHFVAVLAAFCLLAGSNTAAKAEVRQFGDVVYTLPAGWILGRHRDGVQVIVSTNDDCEFCYVYVAMPSHGSGTPASFLSANALFFAREENRGNFEALASPAALSLGKHQAAMQLFRKGDTIYVSAAVKLSGGFQLYAFEGPGEDDAETRRTLDVLSRDGGTLMEAARYVSEGAVPAMPPPVPGDLEGAYWGWYTNFTLGAGGTMQAEVDMRTLVFWKNGLFFDGDPPLGILPTTAAALAQQPAEDWGSYRKQGNRLVLTYANGVIDELTGKDGGWNDGRRTLAPTPVLEDGTRLKGTISTFRYMSFGPGTGVTGGVSSGSDTEFLPDGTYKGSSFGGAFGNFDSGGDHNGGYATSSGTDTGGSYRVAGGMIVFSPSDGSPKRAVLALRSGDDILIGGQFLKTD